MKSTAYLWFPILLFFAAFGVDKLFYVGNIEDYFLRTASFVNYDRKKLLIDELQAYLKQKNRLRVIVMFGNSRTMTFHRDFFEKAARPWVFFNFSVPGGNNDYYAYLMEIFRDRNIRPEMVFFAVSPQGFNDAPNVVMDETMINGLSFSFIIRNATHYKLDEINNYIIKKLFWNYQYRPKIQTVLKKLKNDQLHLKGFRRLVPETKKILKQHRGSVPALNYEHYTRDNEVLRRSAHDTWRAFFRPYRISIGQLYFLDRALNISHELNVPAALLWAKVGPELRKMKNERKVVRGPSGKMISVRAAWTNRVLPIARRHEASFIDMNYGKSIRCDLFVDESHLAPACYHQYARFLMNYAGELQR